jgi:hypothetical protein
VNEEDTPAGGRFEDEPLTRIEYTTARVHFDRGERGRWKT